MQIFYIKKKTKTLVILSSALISIYHCDSYLEQNFEQCHDMAHIEVVAVIELTLNSCTR